VWGLLDSSRTPSPAERREVKHWEKQGWQLNYCWPFDGIPGGISQSRINYGTNPGYPTTYLFFFYKLVSFPYYYPGKGNV